MEYYVDGRQSPNMLVRIRYSNAPIEMCIPNRNAWVPIRGFEHFISPFSSYAGVYAAEEDVPRLMALVPDRGADFLDEYEIKPGD